jgi:hypothetical protein
MGMMVEDVFLDVCGHVSHTILGDMARMSTAETDTVSVLCVAPVKIIISCSRHTPSASMTTHVVSIQERFFFDGRVDGSGNGRLKGFIVFEFFECSSDFFNGRFRYVKCKVCANSGKRGVEANQQFVRDFVLLRFALNGFELMDYTEHFIDKWHDTNCGVVRKQVQLLAKVQSHIWCILFVFSFKGSLCFSTRFDLDDQVPRAWFNQEPDIGVCLLVVFQGGGRRRYSFSGVHELPELLHCEVSLSLFAPSMPILAIKLHNQCEDSFVGRHGCYGE